MKKIKLTQGKFALVDDIDYEWLNQWNWYAVCIKGYWYAIRSKRPQVRMHRLIMNAPPKMFVDHANHNTFNNCQSNLRICTRAENNRNRKKSDGTSKYKGVNWDKNAQKWKAQINGNRKKIHLGLFESEIEAAKAYDKAAIKYFGEFARGNVYEKI